jgi:hypothetical protein
MDGVSSCKNKVFHSYSVRMLCISDYHTPHFLPESCLAPCQAARLERNPRIPRLPSGDGLEQA